MRLKGKVALITGGGSGIGRAIACLFAGEGAQVVLTGRREAPLADVAAEIKDKGGTAIYFAADVSDSEQVKKLVLKARETLGQIDILVNNAGLFIPKSVTELSEVEFDEVMAVNLRGTFLCCKYVIPHMLDQGGGNIVNISSILGHIGTTKGAAYCASKGGVILLTKSLAHDYGPGIRANALCPAHVETEMLDELFMSRGATDLAQFGEEWAQNYPLKRLGTPEDVARAALFLASDDASWITGSSLMVTGGIFA